jgi:gliding motility-associated lipoprotein GldH
MIKAQMLFICLALLAFTACHNATFDERVVIPGAEWDQSNRANFDMDVNDTVNGYMFGITLRHLENYRFSNLYIFLHTQLPNGNVTHDTIECILSTPEGKWIGKSSGSMRDLNIVLNPNLHFPLKGPYHFEIEQAMREPVLKGITDVGLRIDKQ